MYLKNISLLSLFAFFLFSSCVQETHIKEIQFEVDTRAVGEIASLGIRGSLPPLSWNETFELTDPEGDGIFKGKVLVDTGQSSISFKFVSGDANFELANQSDRNLEFEYKPQRITYKAVWDIPEAIVIIE